MDMELGHDIVFAMLVIFTITLAMREFQSIRKIVVQVDSYYKMPSTFLVSIPSPEQSTRPNRLKFDMVPVLSIFRRTDGGNPKVIVWWRFGL